MLSKVSGFHSSESVGEGESINSQGRLEKEETDMLKLFKVP